MVLAKRKNWSFRLRVDYRLLNDATILDAQPMGNLHYMVRGMKGVRIFTVLDLRSGYWQLSIKPDDTLWILAESDSLTVADNTKGN